MPSGTPSPVPRANDCLSPLSLKLVGCLVTVTNALSTGEATCVALTIAEGAEGAEGAEVAEVAESAEVAENVEELEVTI